jgi:putative sterol carrier protein
MYRKTANGWRRQKLVGGQSVEAVEQFIKEGLAQDEVDKKSAAELGDEDAAEIDKTTTHQADAVESEDMAQHG